MTTTAPRQKPAEHHEFKHGPVAAAFNASVVTLFATTLGKLAGLPPWIALMAAALTAAAMVAAGLARRPRRLSRGSLVFRSVAMSSSGLWMWWQLAEFTNPGLSVTQATILMVAWPATVVLLVAACAVNTIPLIIRFAVPALTALFTLSLTVVLGGPVLTWVHGALFVTDRLPWSWSWNPDHLVDNLNWLATATLSIIMIAGPLAVLGTVFANREQTADDELARRERAAVPPTRTAQARKMMKIISDATGEYTDLPGYQERGAPRVKVPLMKIDDIDIWDNDAGETYVINMIDVKNTTVESLRSHTSLFAQKLNLPQGCGVEVLAGESDPTRDLGRGHALVKVNRKNVLKETIPYPPIRPRTVMNMLPVGVLRDGREIGPYLRETSVFLWGQKGSGKTVCMFCLAAGLIQCTDVIVWGIDLNGGSAFAPFLRGWRDGVVDRPCIDWIATTTEEVVTMAEVARDIAKGRKTYYRDLKFNDDTNLMPIGNGEPGQPPPQICILIDEGAMVMGVGGGTYNEAFKAGKEALQTVMDIARDAAVNIIFCGLRATQDVADGAFKAGTAVRIGLRVTDSNELAWGFGDYKLNGSEIPYQGSGFIKTGHEDGEIQIFKGYFLSPKTMQSIGIETTPWRPYLDDHGIKIGGVRYANRWKRTGRYVFGDDCPDHILQYAAVDVTDDDRSEAAEAGATGSRNGSTTGVGGSFADLMRAAQESRAAFTGEPSPDAGNHDDNRPPQSPPPVRPRPERDLDEPDDRELQEQIDRKFRDLMSRFGEPDAADMIDPADPANRVPLPPETEEEINPHSRAVLERLVRARGPLTWKEMWRLLNAGGDWGPAVKMSEQGLRRLTYQPYRPGEEKVPVEWLVPRNRKDPYQHRDNIQ